MTKRRELLKVLSLTGAAGAVWKKPVVDSLVLPAHAESSPTPTDTCESNPTPCAGSYVGTSNGSDGCLTNCANGSCSGAGASLITVNISALGDVEATLFTSTTLTGNTFVLERELAFNAGTPAGTECRLYLVLNGTITPTSNQIDVNEVYEWRCTGTTICTVQRDRGNFLMLPS